MILLLGGSGYVGSVFRDLFERRGLTYRSLSRAESDDYSPDRLAEIISDSKADFLINAAGYTGKPNVDACEFQRTECLSGNAILPGTLRSVCEAAKIPWGHVSSGCIYSGRRLDGRGWLEDDTPNFSFRTNNCSFYSGTKALGEELLEGAERCYIWRLRIPFNHLDSPRNYLSKLLSYRQLLDAENSVSHVDEFVGSCLASWEKKVPFGTYNLTNTGSVTTRDVVELIKTYLAPERQFSFFSDEGEFMKLAAKTPRSNCVLDTSKSEAAGIAMRPVTEALKDALQGWKAESKNSG